MIKYLTLFILSYFVIVNAYAADKVDDEVDSEESFNSTNTIKDPTQPFWMKNEYKKNNEEVNEGSANLEQNPINEKSDQPVKDVNLIDQIIYSGNFRRVRMGGEMLTEGDVVQGFKILHIKPTSVVLTNGKQEKNIDIFKPSIKSYR